MSEKERSKFRHSLDMAMRRVRAMQSEQNCPSGRDGSDHYNFGDSVGLAAFIFAVVGVAITPPLSLKALLLVASGCGCLVFARKSHWTHHWRSSTRWVVG